ncbi:hypothetical protein DVH05_010264 [Phytophthora capsici]|nr:hypothetical protein DVH05_010264 [Phytophthora capsici]
MKDICTVNSRNGDFGSHPVTIEGSTFNMEEHNQEEKEDHSNKSALSEEHELELRKIFDDYDHNGSGDIDIEELRDIAQDLGEPLSEIELKYLRKELDANESGAISWTEFISWWKIPM